ncbi:MAG: prepilin peptidase [Parasporobacterium sp.]|nr:prepilin peptidase [Parasporobacterium sp.]
MVPERVFMFALLIPLSIQDLREKKVTLAWIIFVALLGGITGLATGNKDIEDFIFAAVPGIILFCVSLLTSGIGIGDAWIVLGIGMIARFADTVRTVVWGLFLCAIFALALKVFFHKPGNCRIPFVPFLLGAYILQLVL